MDWSPILISMKTASLSIFITFFIGLFAAWAVVSLKNETLKVICDGILTLPLVLPPTVAGFFLLYLFGVKRPIGQFFIEYFSVKIAFSWIATVLAAVTMSFPLMYRSARGAFEQVDQNLVAAARTLGMSEWAVFWKVLFANATPGILSGGVLAFARKHCGKDKNTSYGGLFRSSCRKYGRSVFLCSYHCCHCIYFRCSYELGRIDPLTEVLMFSRR